MENLFKRIFFFILMPIYGPLALFSHLTYKWWQELRKGNLLEKILFFILALIYGPITLFLHLTYEWWAGLAG
jgi:hypothetical protein